MYTRTHVRVYIIYIRKYVCVCMYVYIHTEKVSE